MSKSSKRGRIVGKYKSEVDLASGKDRAKALKSLLEANARWNARRRDTSANDQRRIVDETSTIDPELRKELLYSWEHGFIEDKPQEQTEQRPPNLLRKDKNRKSGKVVMNPLKNKVRSETPHTIKKNGCRRSVSKK